jgi:hypothetical protein
VMDVETGAPQHPSEREHVRRKRTVAAAVCSVCSVAHDGPACFTPPAIARARVLRTRSPRIA